MTRRNHVTRARFATGAALAALVVHSGCEDFGAGMGGESSAGASSAGEIEAARSEAEIVRQLLRPHSGQRQQEDRIASAQRPRGVGR